MAGKQMSAVTALRPSQRDLALVFYLGWPAFLGAILGWTGAGVIGGQLERPLAIAYWIIGFLVYRLALEISIRILAAVAPKQKTPLVLLCVLSIPLYVFFVTPLFSLLQTLFIPYLPPGVEVQPVPPFVESLDGYMAAMTGSVVILMEWTAANLVFDRVLGFPRFRHVTGYSGTKPGRQDLGLAAPDATKLANSTFLRRVPEKLGTDIIALSAEDHYVRVYTPLGNDLILYRFSDAVSEMPDGLGVQVHRSHWINTSAVTDFQKHDKGQRLTLNGTLEIPVSKRFLELLKANGLEPKV